MNARSIEDRIGRIDRRFVYAGLFLLTLLPLWRNWSMPLYVTEPARMFYQAIEKLPKDKLVVISSDWDAGTQAESRPHHIALVRHLIRRGLKFAIVCVAYPTSVQMAQTATEEAIQLEQAQDRWRYGEHWANLGYKDGSSEPWFRSFSNRLPDGFKEDIHGTALEQIPLMKGVKSFGPEGEISMLINLTGSTTAEKYYQFLGPTKVKIAIACTAVMAPEQYPYLDSGQLVGLLTGMKGAAEYEKLVDAAGRGMPSMAGQSFAHLYILVLIVLGNLSLLVGWWRRRGVR